MAECETCIKLQSELTSKEAQIEHLKVLNRSYLNKMTALRQNTQEHDNTSEELLKKCQEYSLALELACQKIPPTPPKKETRLCQECEHATMISGQYHCTQNKVMVTEGPEGEPAGCSKNILGVVYTPQLFLDYARESIDG